jgi:hypothetical protein
MQHTKWLAATAITMLLAVKLGVINYFEMEIQ